MTYKKGDKIRFVSNTNTFINHPDTYKDALQINEIGTVFSDEGSLITVDEDKGKYSYNKNDIELVEETQAVTSLRPAHYKKGEDSFAWAERKFDRNTCLAIAAFNIHKYNDRSKGQDYEDFGKIADYAMWARSLMEKEDGNIRQDNE